jgi:hypothetical protein
MDFIEKLFGLSPDGGNGVFELTLFAIPCILIGLRVWWVQTSRSQTKRTGKG